MKCQVLIVSILKVDVAHHQPVVCRLQFGGIMSGNTTTVILFFGARNDHTALFIVYQEKTGPN